jgi:hypothetical protein
MAASNAYFWTAQGWDGSPEIMERSRAYAYRLPPHHRVRLFSGSALMTVIITVQGVMAIKTLVGGLDGTDAAYSLSINIGSIFYPLAVLGLLRIFAGMWLTDDYLYLGDIESVRTNTNSSVNVTASKEDPSLLEVQAQTTMSLLDSTEFHSSERFHGIKSWRALIFRALYLVPICCLLAICLIYLVPNSAGNSKLSTTTFLMVLFYLTWLAASAIIYAFYFLSGHSTSSIIPCCNAIWYKIYTTTLMALTLVLVIMACLETRKSPCGTYTTYPSDFLVDLSICPHGTAVLGDHPRYLGELVKVPFGIAQLTSINEDNTVNAISTNETKTIVVSFEGMCFGSFLGNASNGAPVEPVNNTFVPTTYF